jgi:hypothetical protein
MSDIVTLAPDAPIETAIGDPPPATQIPPAFDATEIPATALALPLALPPELHALLELIGQALVAEADPATRAAARDLWARFAQTIAAAAPLPGHVTSPVGPAMPAMSATPAIPAVPMSPIAMATRALRQLPPEQLLDLALQRLRAALPAGATVSTPKGIQFQLVPVTPPPGNR